MPPAHLEAARQRLDAGKPKHVAKATVGVEHELLVAHHQQVLDVRSVLHQELVAAQPVLDQRRVGHPLPRPPGAPELARGARHSDRMADQHDHARAGEERLQEPRPDQVGRRLLDQHRPRVVPVPAPLLEQPGAALVAHERRLLGQMGIGVEPEPARPAILARGRVHGLQVLALILGRAGGGEAAHLRMLGHAAAEQRRATAVQPADEHERVLLPIHLFKPGRAPVAEVARATPRPPVPVPLPVPSSSHGM